MNFKNRFKISRNNLEFIRFEDFSYNISKLTLLIFLYYCLTLADSWLPGAFDKDNTYKIGDLDCRLTVKELRPKNGWEKPKGIFSCKKNSTPFFEKQNFGADNIIASDDGKYILGTSNTALHNYAFWILNDEGRVIATMKHDRTEISYCKRSITLLRTWTHQSPNPSFSIRNGRLEDISIKSCSNSIISLNKLATFWKDYNEIELETQTPTGFETLTQNGCDLSKWKEQHPNSEFGPLDKYSSKALSVLGVICKESKEIRLKVLNGKLRCPPIIPIATRNTLIGGISLGEQEISKRANLTYIDTQKTKSLEKDEVHFIVKNLYNNKGYIYVCIGNKWLFQKIGPISEL